MPAEFEQCEASTCLLHADYAEILRGAADDEADTVLIDLALGERPCLLEELHPGPCAAWVARLPAGEAVNAWLRWDEDGRRQIDWLANCANGDCLLFRGHAAACHVSAKARGAS